MSIRPYPSQWETVFEMASGPAILIRPIRPDDETRYAAFFGELSPDDVRMRFFMPMKQLDHAFVARLTQIDYAREMAFVALGKPEGNMLGVVRFAADPDYKRGEFAVLVRSDLKGRGLGWKLMQHLVEYARAEGLVELSGSVLAENTTMLTMCRELGFAVSIDPEDAAVRIVRLAL